MPMLGAILTPHPPLLLPEVGRGREQEIPAIHRAIRDAANEVARWNPEVLIVASPHTVLYGDYFHIAPREGASGSMAAYGAPQVKIRAQYDLPLRDEIIRNARAAGLPAGTLGEKIPSLTTAFWFRCIFCVKQGWIARLYGWGCPAHLHWSTTGWGSA